MRNISLFESERLTLEDSLSMTADSLNAYSNNYRHWASGYSVGRVSTATVA